MVMVEGGGLVRVFNNMDIFDPDPKSNAIHVAPCCIYHAHSAPMHTTQTQADVRLRVGIEL
jgi:hypothetical protein